MNVTLETKDIIIKKGEQKDWKDMYYNLWRHAESAKYMLWNVTTSEEDAQDRMARTIKFEETHPYAWIVYEKKSNQAIGFAGMEEIEASKRLQESCGFQYSHTVEKIDPRNDMPYKLIYTSKEFTHAEA